MMKMTKRRIRRLLTVPCLLLALCLTLSVTALAVNEVDDQGEVPKAALTVKPVVTIQGNVVVDNGKPTGYYELALCVRSARTITLTADGSAVSEEAYANDIAADPNHATDGTYTVIYHPFSAAAATVGVNADALTAVNWDVTEVTYAAWDAAAGQYADDDTGYPRGIDVIANTDPEVWLGTDPDPFPDVTQARQNGVYSKAVALDAEGDRSAFTATGQVDDYYENIATGTKTALVTLSAHAPDNKPVVFTTDTPVAVVRFSYDLKRFNKTAVSENQDVNYDITGEEGTDGGFWLGFDRGSDPQVGNGNKTPLTWLADTAQGGSFAFSDQKAASTEMGQVVWTKIGVATVDEDGVATGGWDETDYYYYLGAEGYNKYPDTETIQVNINGVPTAVEDVAIPATVGAKVLTPGSAQNPGATPAEYTYFVNLLRLADRTLRLKMVNEPTFRRPTGISGPQILFYDWDDTLIGSLMVTKGDVRAQVNAYLEKTLVHPDLRSDSPFMVDESGSGGMSQEEKYASLTRDYTYRGKYAYTVGGNDADLGVENGKEYPLTNKLDYVFTKRVNTAITQTENGSQVQYVHPYSLDDPELDAAQEDGALYPWVYGWAVVEDTRAFNGNKAATGDLGEWKVMHDAAKLEDTWTTMGVGELSNTKRATMTNSTLSTVAAVDPNAERFAPVFLADNDPAWTDGTKGNDYVYTLEGQNAYLRFADFSDITAEMDRYTNKDTLIVKAVYESGTSLMEGSNYTLIAEPAYTKWNNLAASDGGAYRVQLTVERSYNNGGIIQGASRIRVPIVQQDTTIDYKWLSNAEKGVNNDLDNTTFETSTTREETLYTQVDADNGEEITFSLALSPRQNRVDYVLVERYDSNFVVGTQRSGTNNSQRSVPSMFIPDNYNYLAGKDSDTTDDIYDSDFSTKEGSHGFVLYGTLGYFLEQATQRNAEKITLAFYNGNITYSAAQDANLRMDLVGSQPNFMSNAVLQNAFLAAALKCEAHRGDPAYDCWDENLDAAKLTYHQAQWFLLDYQSNPNCDILPVATAEDSAHKLVFCHYHISCSGGHVPVAPTTWKELVDKLREYNGATPGSDDEKNALSDLEAMELSALDSITGLRARVTGGKFTSAATFISTLVTAEDRLNTRGVPVNWCTLQYAILNGVPSGMSGDAMREEAQEDYWWYAGATSAPKVNDFAGLMAAAQTARAPVTLKDGDNTFLPKSALTAATYPTGAVEYLTAASPTRGQRNGWVTLTDNLVPVHSETEMDPDETPNSGDEYVDYTYGRFTDMDDFLDQFTTVYYDIYDAVYDAGTMDEPADKDEWWEVIQTALLPAGDNLGVYQGDDSTKFWWKGGNTPFRITNLNTLLECARRLANPGSTDPDAYMAALNEWNRVTVEDIESVAISQGLRWKGTDAAHPMYPYTGQSQDGDKLFGELTGDTKAAILAQLQSAVGRFDAAVAANPGLTVNWERIQYLILNPGPLPANSVINAQRVFYWWQNGNAAGTTVALSPNPMSYDIDLNIEELIKATYRADFKDPGVTSSILAAAADGTFWNVTRLITAKKTDGSWDNADPDGSTYIGPDNDAEAKEMAFPGGSAADVQALLDVLTRFRDVAKADPNQGTSDPYGVPGFNWQEVQYYILNGETFLDWNSQIIKDLRDKDKSASGDYWWYYATARTIPEPPPSDEPSDEFRDNVLLPAVLGTSAMQYPGKAGMQEMGMMGKPNGSHPTDNNAKKIWNYLIAELQAQPDREAATKALTWVQIQYYYASAYGKKTNCGDPGILTDPASALAGLIALGFNPADFPPGTKTTFSLRSAELTALDIEELPEMETPLAADAQEAAPEVTETVTPETAADLRDRIEAMERELEALKERLEALEAASTPVEAPEETPAPAKPAPTPVKPVAPVKPEPAPTEPETPEQVELAPVEQEPAPETPETPAETEPVSQEPTPAPNYNERVETPLGEEAVWRGVRIVNTARQRDGSSVVPTARTVPAVLLDVGVLPPRPKYILVRRA